MRLELLQGALIARQLAAKTLRVLSRISTLNAQKTINTTAAAVTAAPSAASLTLSELRRIRRSTNAIALIIHDRRRSQGAGC